MKKRIYISVINDLVTDQRIHRVAGTIALSGADVILVGRKLPHSARPPKGNYRCFRMKLLFEKGFLFYAAFNIRLFFFLLTRRKIDLLIANDPDTLVANYMVSLLRNKIIVYDSHELFTEVPELNGRAFVKSFWGWVERIFIPKIKYAYTVNDSLASILKDKYGTDFKVIRNLPEINPVKLSERNLLDQSERNSENQPERNPENQPEQNPENQPERNSVKLSEQNPENQPERNPENLPDPNPENHPEGNFANLTDGNTGNLLENNQTGTYYDIPKHIKNNKIIIYQGAVNTGRGIENLIEAVAGLEGVTCIIAGGGDVVDEIADLIENKKLEDKIFMTGRLQPEQLRSLTSQCDLGVSLEQNVSLNYYYALPNKLFDYIHAGIPVLVSDFPEMRKIVREYNVGLTVNQSDINEIRHKLRVMLYDEDKRKDWIANTQKAKKVLNWENEQKKLISLYTMAGLSFPE